MGPKTCYCCENLKRSAYGYTCGATGKPCDSDEDEVEMCMENRMVTGAWQRPTPYPNKECIRRA